MRRPVICVSSAFFLAPVTRPLVGGMISDTKGDRKGQFAELSLTLSQRIYWDSVYGLLGLDA